MTPIHCSPFILKTLACSESALNQVERLRDPLGRKCDFRLRNGMVSVLKKTKNRATIGSSHENPDEAMIQRYMHPNAHRRSMKNS